MPASFSFTKRLNSNLSSTNTDAVRRTEFDDGYAKQVAKFSVQKRIFTMSYLLSDAQHNSFLTWFTSTVNYGSAFFDFVEPLAGTTVQGRLVNGEFDAKPASAVQNYWIVSMNIEVYI